MTNILIVASAAPPVLGLSNAVACFRDEGWEPSVIMTPTASTWLPAGVLAERASCTVRVHPRLPQEPKEPTSKPDAILVAPLTFNTLNKWALGLSDNVALGVLNEALGSGTPLVVVTCMKSSLQRHPAHARSVATLQTAGVQFLDPDPLTFRLGDGLLEFDWGRLVRAMPVMGAKPSTG